MKQLMVFSLAFLSVSTGIAKNNTQKLVRSAVLSPGYVERVFNSNEMIKHIPLSFMQGSSYYFDLFINMTDNKFAKLAIGTGYSYLHYVLAKISSVVYHEFGHARALASFGMSYKFGIPIDNRTYYKASNVFEFYGLMMNKYSLFTKKGAATYFDSRNFTNDQDLILSAGGLNNQMRLSQEVADLIDENKGHILYAFDYVKGKISSYEYASITEQQLNNGVVSKGNDIQDIRNDYAKKGINVSISDIKNGSLISLGLSATTWAFVYSAFKNYNSGMLIESPVWRGWRLPDVNFYITSKGLSYEVLTGYHLNEHWYFALSTEFVYKGNKAFELSPFCVYKFEKASGTYKIKGQVTTSQNFDIGGGVSLDWTSLSKTWGLGAKYICHNASTLVGERNIPFVKNSNINHEMIATVSFYF